MGNAPSGTALEVNLAVLRSNFNQLGSGSPDCKVTSTALGCSVTKVETSSGKPKEKPVPETLESAGTLTATKPTVEVSGRSNKSTAKPFELPEEPAPASPPDPPPPPPLFPPEPLEDPAGAGAELDPPEDELADGAVEPPPELGEEEGLELDSGAELGAGEELGAGAELGAGCRTWCGCRHTTRAWRT